MPNPWTTKKLIFIAGKGGVGKSTIAKETAENLAASGKKVLLCHVLQLAERPQSLQQRGTHFYEIYLNSKDCFDEYIQLKLKIPAVAKVFLGNKITQYLEKASPGLKELVLTGKIWFERHSYDHVIVDMPSTGYALTMLFSPGNFATLFPSGLISADAREMVKTLDDPAQTALVCVALPEEMPVQEGLEFLDEVHKKLPGNKPYVIVNRVLPENLLSITKETLTQLSAQPALQKAAEHLHLKAKRQYELLSDLKNKTPFEIKYESTTAS